MNNDERRQTRIRVLRQVWIQSGYDDNTVIIRALQMGVAQRTANEYLKTIKQQVRSRIIV